MNAGPQCDSSGPDSFLMLDLRGMGLHADQFRTCRHEHGNTYSAFVASLTKLRVLFS